jgi:hypothetical protein
VKITNQKDGFKIEVKPRTSFSLRYLGIICLVFWFAAISLSIFQLANGNLPQSRFEPSPELGLTIWIIIAIALGLLYLNYWIYQVFGSYVLIQNDKFLTCIRTKNIFKTKWSIKTSQIACVRLNKDFYSTRIRIRGEYIFNPEGGILFRVGRRDYFYGQSLPQDEAKKLVSFISTRIKI